MFHYVFFDHTIFFAFYGYLQKIRLPDDDNFLNLMAEAKPTVSYVCSF